MSDALSNHRSRPENLKVDGVIFPPLPSPGSHSCRSIETERPEICRLSSLDCVKPCLRCFNLCGRHNTRKASSPVKASRTGTFLTHAVPNTTAPCTTTPRFLLRGHATREGPTALMCMEGAVSI